MSPTPKAFPPEGFPYRVDRKLGEGAMGAVYRAFDADLTRWVAIKVMRAETLEGEDAEAVGEARRRFTQEARAAAALTHPGVTVIHRIGEEGGQPYIVMEWLDGETLESLLTRRAPLPVAEAARIVAELAEALDAAHRAGVVHRDVKPANLILLPGGRLKVTDFGIARMLGSDLVKTRAGDVMATPMYGSPEQLFGNEVDGRSDIFSAGIVLYRALSGRPPFSGRNVAEVVSAILNVEPAPLRQLNPAVPEALERVVMRALEKRRELRFAHADELARELRRFTAVEGDAEPPADGESTRPDATFGGAETFAVFSGREAQTGPVVAALPVDVRVAVIRVVESWPSRALGRVGVSDLLDQLLRFPLHAEPFSGGVRVGAGTLLLLDAGRILGAIGGDGGISEDEVVERLPSGAEVTLHPVPAALSPRLVPLLASLLGPRRVRHADLDSSFVNLPALAQKLVEEAFSGVLILARGASTGWILLDQGKTCLSLFSEGWRDAPVELPWQSWVSRLAVKASVEEAAPRPLFEAYRRLLKDLDVAVTPGSPVDAAETARKESSGGFLVKSKPLRTRRPTVARPRLERRALTPSEGRTGSAPPELLAEAFAADPARAALDFILGDLPDLLAERGKVDTLKYVASWLPLVTRAALHHDLPRPQSRDVDAFDLVTFDAEGKALHVGHRVARATPEALAAFVARVIAAKVARAKTGDIGGAFLVSPVFDEATARAYAEAIAIEGERRSWTFGAIESATHYDGFVRIGPRRGFHLVLLEEREDGFRMLLP